MAPRRTEYFLPDREYPTPQTEWRWTGTRTIQDIVIPAYAEVYPNLRQQDRRYPTPAELQSKVSIGNIEFEGEMDADTAGSDRIKQLLLDRDPRPLYLQAWGGTSTIARALKSIETEYSSRPGWARLKARISAKAVIVASGFQDLTYADYIAPNWPDLMVQELSAGYATWGYNCNWTGGENTRGLPADRELFRGAWARHNIQIGPYGSLYRSWLDGQAMPGDPLDIFGLPDQASSGWCKPFEPYDFLSEGDNVAFNTLLPVGIQSPADLSFGSWGGRAYQVTKSPNLWQLVETEQDSTGTAVDDYTTLRWAAAAQYDFAARIQWTLTSKFADANHAPSVEIAGPATIKVRPGEDVRLRAAGRDPDRDDLSYSWWQYREEGTSSAAVEIIQGRGGATVTVPSGAAKGDTISIIAEVSDDGSFPLTRYDRVILQVR